MNELLKQENESFNFSVTENGALGYTTTLNPFVDFSFKVSSFRNNPQEAINLFDKCLKMDKKLAVRLLFYLRDVRGGCGERNTFRVIATHLSNTQESLVLHVLPYFSEYGRWDDVLDLYFTTGSVKIKRNIIRMIYGKLQEDVLRIKFKQPISLLAKWMPSINVKSQRNRALELMNALGLKREESYRRLLSYLRKYLKIVEQKMSANSWGEIDYSKVPSKANLKYNACFLRHDRVRRNAFLQQVIKGEQKINSSTNTPADIVESYWNKYSSRRVTPKDDGLEALWNALPIPPSMGDTLVIADVSGSMYGKPLMISHAMACYFSAFAKGAYKDKAIIFSSRPYFVDLDYDTLAEKLTELRKHGDCSNTDIKATFDLILQTAINTHAKQDDLPSRILIISDMEFDGATVQNVDGRLFNEISYEYEMAGYKMPKLVFWNVNSRTKTIPLIANELGVGLVSGYSPYIAEMVMSGKLEPFEQLKERLNTPRYDLVAKAVL